MIASEGQTSTQAIQSVHNSGSITYISSPSLIAPSGHSGSQAAQDMQSSVILWAMIDSLVKRMRCNYKQELGEDQVNQ
jgi:hypothetical protein